MAKLDDFTADEPARPGKVPEPARAPEGPVKVLTVTELNRYVQGVLRADASLKKVLVSGEVSNFSEKSGHLYFALKDSWSLVWSVMFRGKAEHLKFKLSDGLAVVVEARVDLYAPRGSYQLVVSDIQPAGVGALYLAFEQLKRKLEAEGLFATERKRRLPQFPNRIGIITSETGAVIHDMLNIIGRRYPVAEVVFRPALVQGDGAASDLVRALTELNALGNLDVIIIGRGGGSMEDLWEFNDENLVRALAASKTPVVSAVGHETDFTISDFVADVRAPTPSVAAELVAPDRAKLLVQITSLRERLANGFRDILGSLRDRLARAQEHLVPRRLLLALEESTQRVCELAQRAENALRGQLSKRMLELEGLAGKLQALSPAAILARGYAIVTRMRDGRVVRSVEDVAVGEKASIKVADGSVTTTVNELKKSQGLDGSRGSGR